MGVKVGRMHGLRAIWNDSPETIPVAQRLRIHHTDTLSPTPMHTNDLAKRPKVEEAARGERTRGGGDAPRRNNRHDLGSMIDS